MSTEYMMRMQALQRNREELAARRRAIEKRMELREAMAAEFSEVALQSCKLKWKRLRSEAVAAKTRNDQFIRLLDATRAKANDACLRQKNDLSSAQSLLDQEKERYFRKIEEVYPAWKERVQQQRLRTLQQLEQKKRAVEKRRYLAKKTFEKEQSLEDLIRQTTHEIELSENLEKNEAHERAILRSQSATQAVALTHSIREHATGAREYLQQLAAEELRQAAELDEETNERIFETFSPRHALNSVRDANRMISFAEPPERIDNVQRSIVVQLESSLSHQNPPSREIHQDLYAQLDSQALAQTQRPNSMHILIPRAPVAISEESSFKVCSASPAFAAVVANSSTQNALTGNLSLETKAASAVVAMSSVPAPDAIEQPREVISTGMEVTMSPLTVKTTPIATIDEKQDAESVPVAVSENESSAMKKESPVLRPLPTSSIPTVLKDIIEISESKTVEDVSVIMSDADGSQQLSQSMDQLSQSAKGFSDATMPCNVSLENKPGSVSPVEERPTVDLSLQIVYSYDSNQSIYAPDWNRQSVNDLSKSEVMISNSPSHKSEYFVVVQTPAEDHNSHESKAQSQNEDAEDKLQAKTSPVENDDSKVHSFVNSSVGVSVQSQDPDWIQVPVPSISLTPSKSPGAATSDNLPLNSHDIVSSAVFSEDSMSISQSLDVQQSVERSELDKQESRDLASSSVLFSDDSLSVSGLISPVRKDTKPKFETTDMESKADNVPTVANEMKHSATEKLSMVDRAKALEALTARVEEGATDGDRFSGISDSSPYDTKRELIKMAIGGRKAQIGFFGSDICFELVLDICCDLGPVLFPPRAFEGVMNEQRMKKVHQGSKDKELDLWKLLSNHMKQMYTLKAMEGSALVDTFSLALLNHDLENKRSQRKLREFLLSVCGAPASASQVAQSPSPSKSIAAELPKSLDTSPNATMKRTETPSLLQTAFLQHQSPPKSKTFGLVSASSKKKERDDDVLKFMAASPTRLAQKLMRGGKMGDYSEFEEEEEVDLQKLIGSSGGRSTRSTDQASAAPRPKVTVTRDVVDEFDVDF